jgi:hypothetical protein
MADQDLGANRLRRLAVRSGWLAKVIRRLPLVAGRLAMVMD